MKAIEDRVSAPCLSLAIDLSRWNYFTLSSSKDPSPHCVGADQHLRLLAAAAFSSGFFGGLATRLPGAGFRSHAEVSYSSRLMVDDDQRRVRSGSTPLSSLYFSA